MGRVTIRRRLVIVFAVSLLTLAGITSGGATQPVSGSNCSISIDLVVSTMDRADAIAWLQNCSARSVLAVSTSPALDRADEIARLQDAGRGR